jgi:hypothetical protein
LGIGPAPQYDDALSQDLTISSDLGILNKRQKLAIAAEFQIDLRQEFIRYALTKEINFKRHWGQNAA